MQREPPVAFGINAIENKVTARARMRAWAERELQRRGMVLHEVESG
jgi:hypothetical protein